MEVSFKNDKECKYMNFKQLATVMVSGALLCTSVLSQAKVIDKVVAIVDSGVVLQSEVDNMLRRIKDNAKSQNQSLPSETELKEQVLEQLVSRRIQLQMALNMGFQIGDAQLDQSLEKIATGDNISTEQLRLKLIASGEDFESFRENLREELTLNEVKNGSVRRRIYVGPQEIDSLIKLIAKHGNTAEEFNLGHILLTVPTNPNEAQLDAVKKQADRIIELLGEGQDFKQLAMTSSAGSKALQGGELGFKSTNEMPTLFATAITGHKKGDFMGPIQSGAGFHILTIFDIKGRETVEVNEIRSRHLLIKPSIILSEEKAQEMQKLFIAQINSGEKTFAELAKQHSEDPGTALKEGVLEWIESKVLDPAYKEQIETLEIGQISKPFRTSFGWHIVEVLGRRVQDATEQKKREQAHRMIFNRKFSEEAENWYHEIRAQAYVEILPES
jgi:peptidyl-prolyl cis-trans isomerase SurA